MAAVWDFNDISKSKKSDLISLRILSWAFRKREIKKGKKFPEDLYPNIVQFNSEEKVEKRPLGEIDLRPFYNDKLVLC